MAPKKVPVLVVDENNNRIPIAGRIDRATMAALQTMAARQLGEGGSDTPHQPKGVVKVTLDQAAAYVAWVHSDAGPDRTTRETLFFGSAKGGLRVPSVADRFGAYCQRKRICPFNRGILEWRKEWDETVARLQRGFDVD